MVSDWEEREGVRLGGERRSETRRRDEVSDTLGGERLAVSTVSSVNLLLGRWCRDMRPLERQMLLLSVVPVC